MDYLVSQARSEHDVSTVEGKIAAINQILPFVSLISNRLERVEQAKHVAESFGVEESVIREELKKGAHFKKCKIRNKITQNWNNSFPIREKSVKSDCKQ